MEMKRKKQKVLIGSAVRQSPEILKEFLESLNELDKDNYKVDYYFIDNNDQKASKELLETFAKSLNSSKGQSNKNRSKVIIHHEENDDKYECNEITHHWNHKLIWKVAEFKDRILKYSSKNDYDFVFLVDSDLVLHPKTLKQLVDSEKDIVSEIFWTRWKPNTQELPQVWLYDQYTMYKNPAGLSLNEKEIQAATESFLQKLKKPGLYEVGGLGACTLISKKAIQKGVSFKEINNISFWGEDRHFCVRAAALGFKLYVDTHYPAYHIYRASDLNGIDAYKKNQAVRAVDNQEAQYMFVYDKETLANAIKHFLLGYMYCDYRIITGYEEHSLIFPKYAARFSQVREKMVDWLIENKVICSAQIKDIELPADITEKGQVFAKVKFTLKGRSIQGEFEKQYLCNMFLDRFANDWKISFFSFYNDKGMNILGFTLADILQERERRNKEIGNKLTLAMMVRNEAGNLLERVLSHAAKYIDKAVILDDASDDNTVEICEKVLSGIPTRIISNRESGFRNEINLRKQLWDMTVETDPDWILCLDADEIFEDSIIDHIGSLINQPNFDYYAFRLYDFWNESQYREDKLWQAHRFYRPFLVRYQPNFDYIWNEKPLHCGRFPMNITQLEGCQCNIRLRHYGWATPALREKKYKRYMELDPEGMYGNINQYRSILDPRPNLIDWK
ncbi:MAG: glycosyltransferase [Clostridiaceae bacterium]|nr:glycosyltransferase [Clostridiaceae bacterium]